MRLTKYGHACVRIDNGDSALVIDPGVYSEPVSFDGVAAVLVTHEHADHVDLDLLRAARERNPELTVHTHPALAAELGDGVQAVSPGDVFTAAGFTVRAVGGEHAEIIDGLPGCPNVGFVVDGVYHPGDSLFVPSEPVETLLIPAAGPWLKIGDAIRFARAVRPHRSFPIHDGVLNDLGLHQFDAWLGDEEGIGYSRIPLGESVAL
ncbi:MBL fold metallo-hydrolase [Catellatospora citrea]|uniref:MBL fold metallo-hydrolase n=1 Tax=Catellatospora citrea TaxID=53366 RepID=UPI0033CB708B